MHSFLWAEHEEQVGRLAAAMGFTNVSLSSRVMRMVKIVRRQFCFCSEKIRRTYFIQRFRVASQRARMRI